MQDFKTDVFKVCPDGKFLLKEHDTHWVPNWSKKFGRKKNLKDQAEAVLEASRNQLIVMQELLWASDTYAMLIILQGMDAAGKDSTIKHVMSGVNPQGCQVTSFKTPTQEEMDHDFLWRYAKALPNRGLIGIFNRSYYEDVLVVKVHPEMYANLRVPVAEKGKHFWDRRYQDISLFERHLVRNGTVVLKFFLHLSKEEQRQRFLQRLEDPEKYWKFSLNDLSERARWKEYMDVYEEMLNETSTKWAPWYIIPADEKWVAHAIISEIIANTIKELDLHYPGVSSEQKKVFKKARLALEENKEIRKKKSHQTSYH